MKVLFDTSVLVAAMVEVHPMHGRSIPWLRRAREGRFAFLAASHTLAELYAVLSTLPVVPRISPGEAWRLVHDNVEKIAKIIPLSRKDYSITLRALADLGLSGGIIYDALIVTAAKKSRADRLLTLNPDDFRRLWPEGSAILATP